MILCMFKYSLENKASAVFCLIIFTSWHHLGFLFKEMQLCHRITNSPVLNFNNESKHGLKDPFFSR